MTSSPKSRSSLESSDDSSSLDLEEERSSPFFFLFFFFSSRCLDALLLLLLRSSLRPLSSPPEAGERDFLRRGLGLSFFLGFPSATGFTVPLSFARCFLAASSKVLRSSCAFFNFAFRPGDNERVRDLVQSSSSSPDLPG